MAFKHWLAARARRERRRDASVERATLAAARRRRRASTSSTTARFSGLGSRAVQLQARRARGSRLRQHVVSDRASARHADVRRRRGRRQPLQGRRHARSSKASCRRRKPLLPQLAAAGYAPRDITYFALSHFHSDHTANANEFASATWIVQKAERDFMFADSPQGIIQPATLCGAAQRQHQDPRQRGLRRVRRRHRRRDGDAGPYAGAPSRRREAREPRHRLLGGDLYHYPEERTTGRIPTFEFNAEQSKASRARVEQYLEGQRRGAVDRARHRDACRVAEVAGSTSTKRPAWPPSRSTTIACSPTSTRGCTAGGTLRSRAIRSSSRRAALHRAARRRAVDLGAGCGFQAIPLARLGFAVTAIDLDRKLLAELASARRRREDRDRLRRPRRFPPSCAESARARSSAWSTRCCTSPSQEAVDAPVRATCSRRWSLAARSSRRSATSPSQPRSSTGSSPCAATSGSIFIASSSSSPRPSRFTTSSIGASTAAGSSPRATTASCGCRRLGSCRRCAPSGFEKVETGLDRGLVVVTATK